MRFSIKSTTDGRIKLYDDGTLTGVFGTREEAAEFVKGLADEAYTNHNRHMDLAADYEYQATALDKEARALLAQEEPAGGSV